MLIWVAAIVALLLAFGAGVLATKLLTDPERVLIVDRGDTAAAAQPRGDADIVIDILTEDGQVKLCEVLTGRLKVTANFSGDDPDTSMRTAERVARADPAVEVIRTETQRQAYDRFRELFADHPDMVELLRPDSLPASIDLSPKADTPITAVKAKAAALPGVVTEGQGESVPGPSVNCAISDSGLKAISEATEHGQAPIP